MHDPLHVITHVRWPIPNPRRRRPKMGRGFLIWAFRGKTWRGTSDGVGDEPTRVPLRRRAFLSTYMLRGLKYEYPLFTIATLWHRDPEIGGDDSSCRTAARARRQAAIKQHQFIRAAALDWWWKHYDWFHVRHWSLQLNVLQALRRRLFTRCATCGGRSKPGRVINFHVNVSGKTERRRRDLPFRERWLTGEPNLHHHDCADLASVRAMKANLEGWHRQWGNNEPAMDIQREREPYYGCYPWWREIILGEAAETARTRAAAHVQRSCHPCDRCAAGMLPTGEACGVCDGAGFPRVEKPIPAEAI